MRPISRFAFALIVSTLLPYVASAQCVHTKIPGTQMPTLVNGLAFKGSGGGWPATIRFAGNRRPAAGLGDGARRGVLPHVFFLPFASQRFLPSQRRAV